MCLLGKAFPGGASTVPPVLQRAVLLQPPLMVPSGYFPLFAVLDSSVITLGSHDVDCIFNVLTNVLASL